MKAQSYLLAPEYPYGQGCRDGVSYFLIWRMLLKVKDITPTPSGKT
ncbi:MAG: hypothetical protein AAGU27_16730 [Dehalobacterium sp.]